MASLNKLQLIGNLTRDPELRHTPKGTAVSEISLAINRQWTNEAGQKQEEVTFVEVTFWGRQAETLQQYTAKGDPLFVEGRLQLDTWDDKDTGKKRSKLRVVGESFQFLRSKGDAGDRANHSGMSQEESSARARQRQPAGTRAANAAALPPGSQSATADNNDFQEDDDTPF